MNIELNTVGIGRDFAAIVGDSSWMVVLLLLAGTFLLGVQALRACRRASDAAPFPDADPGE